jgi:hypothetical protein
MSKNNDEASPSAVAFITPCDFDGAPYRFLILMKGTATSQSRFFIQDVCVSIRTAATGSSRMTRKLLTIGAATAFVVASFGAWAQNANDGPKYANMESHKQYKDQRILDHANAAPRYAVTATNKQYKDQRILDHNNGAPRYAVTTTSGQPHQGAGQASPARQRVRVVHTIRRHPPTAHANAGLAHHE